MTDLISRSAVIDVLQELVDMETCGNTVSDIGFGLSMAIGRLISAPAIDAVPVVRCKDCKYWKPCQSENRKFCVAIGYGYMTNPDGYCHMGARMGAESEEDTDGSQTD